MKRLEQQFFFVSFVSQVLAASVLFIMASGMWEHRTIFVHVFVITAGTLALIHFLKYWLHNKMGRNLSFILGVLTLAVGGVTYTADIGGFSLPAVSVFLGLGIFLLYRMAALTADRTLVREVLLGQFRQDIGFIAVGGFLAWIFEKDPAWQGKMLLYFIAFLFTRAFALSIATQAQNGWKAAASFWEWMNRNLLFAVGGFALLCSWLFVSYGNLIRLAVTKAVLLVAAPVLGGVGRVLQFILAKLQIQYKMNSADSGTDLTHTAVDVTEQMQHDYAHWKYAFQGIVYLMGVAVLCYIFWILYKKMVTVTTIDSELVPEEREFIRQEKPKDKKYSLNSPSHHSLTKIRKAYQRVLSVAKNKGIPRKTSETPLEFAGRIADKRPALQSSIQELTDLYLRERYGKEDHKADEQRALQLSDNILHDLRDS